MIFKLPGKEPFDTDHAGFKAHCKPKQDYMLANYDKPVTEAEFVKAVNSMPKHDGWSGGHSPSAARDEYRHAVKKYGLFGGA